LINTIKNIYLW